MGGCFTGVSQSGGTSADKAGFRRWSAKSIPRKAGALTLLGAGRWIYRVVCTEEVEKVYVLESVLGRGGFGTVYKALHKEMNYHRAVKKIDKTGHEETDLVGEIYTLMDLDHPHIMKLSRMYDNGKELYIVAELCSGPSLLQRILDRPMTEQESGVALRHVLKAVLCCHSHYLGHYDIKPDNFMYSEADCRTLKMIDLGMSSNFKRESEQFKGTVTYTAPEVWNGVYGPEADIWSCGVILYMLTTRTSMCPMHASDDRVKELVGDKGWLQSKLDRCKDEGASADCLDLLGKMLHTDRHMRITAAEALEHPFITKTYKHEESNEDEKEKAMLVIKTMVVRFKEFGNEAVLVRAVLLVMVHIAAYITNETKAMRLAYSMLDVKGVGEISIESIESAVEGINEQNKDRPGKQVTLPENLGEAFKHVDLDRDGYVTYGDFLAATLPRSLRCREDLSKRVFRLMDRNADGFIDEDDLARIFLSEDERTDEDYLDQCKKALREVTGDKAGLKKARLNFDEFFKVILGGRQAIANSQRGFENLVN